MRAAVARSTALGLRAKEAMDAGKLVDDEIVLGMIRERLAESDVANGFILDGFPRNIAQAEALDALLSELGQPLDAVVQMDVEYGELLRRISGRRSCSECGRVFNLFSTPQEQIETEICPKTGGAHKLFQRPDDTEATVAKRLTVYEEKTKPLIDFYRGKGVLQSINAEGDVDDITSRLESALQAVKQGGDQPSAAKQGAARRGSAGKGRAKPKATKRSGVKKGVAKKGAGKRGTVKKGAAKRSVAKKGVRRATAAAKSKRGALKTLRTKTSRTKKTSPAKKAPARRAAARKTAKKSARKVSRR